MGLSVNGAVQRAEQVARWMATQEKFRAKAGEKLSSGRRLNRASDDAAGLSISETLRTQVRGDLQAARNIQDGISMLNVAEGGMDTIAGILQRMRELAVQSANGTYTQTDRAAIEAEFQALKAQINNVTETAEYNGMNLLRGDDSDPSTWMTVSPTVTVPYTTGSNTFNYNASSVMSAVPAYTPPVYDVDGVTVLTPGFYSGTIASVALAGAEDYGISGAAGPPSIAVRRTNLNTGVQTWVNAADINYDGANVTFSGATQPQAGERLQVFYVPAGSLTRNVSGAAIDSSIEVNGGALTAGVDYTYAAATNQITLIGNARPSALAASSITVGFVTGLITQIDLGIAANRDFEGGIIDPATIQVTVDGQATGDFTLVPTQSGYVGDTALNSFIVMLGPTAQTLVQGNSAPSNVVVTFDQQVPPLSNPVSFDIQSGANQGQITTVSIDRVTQGGLRIVTATVANQTDAATAISWMDEAIGILSANRGRVGAAVNRLEHAYNNVTNAAEMQQRAESHIRDADMASTITEQTNRQILFNSGSSMFKQATYSAQYLLQLLG